MYFSNEAEFVLELEDSIKSLKKRTAKFAEEYAKDPEYALRWSMDAFEAAGKLYVHQNVRAALVAPDSKATLKNVYEHACREALRGARWPERSTSPVSNIVAECKTAAWAELAEDLRQCLTANDK